MIRVVEGDVTKASEAIIGHQVNCRGVMGSGVAKAIREKFPAAYHMYKAVCETSGPSSRHLGKCQLVQCEDKIIANLFGQDGFGVVDSRCSPHTNYIELRKALTELRDFALKMGHSVALPFGIGCGLGGGQWHVVDAMLQELFSGENIQLVLYRLE